MARALRRIRDGAVDSLGVAGLAAELAVSERHLRRMLIDEVGAAPLQLARTRRAHAARSLIEQTSLTLTDIAFAAGFGSVRQFGDTMREEFGVPPSALPRAQEGVAVSMAADPHSDYRETPTLSLRLSTRAPFDARAMRAYLGAHAIPGRDEVPVLGSEAHEAGMLGSTAHALDVPGGVARATIAWDTIIAPEGSPTVGIPVTLRLPGLGDTLPAIQVLRRMLDLDADPLLIADAFGADATLGPLVAARAGLRLPGARHPHEFALSTVLGQQVSLAAARTLQGRLVSAFGLPGDHGLFGAPDVAAIAADSPDGVRERLGITRARAATVHALAAALSNGLDLGPGADREDARRQLGAIRGIGPWTVEMVAMRSLGDPDAYPSGDLILRRVLDAESSRSAEHLAEAWRPLRAYATQHLWAGFLAESQSKG